MVDKFMAAGSLILILHGLDAKQGGMLASPPNAVQEVFWMADAKTSFASWAIRFAASLPGVITVLSGMSTAAYPNQK